MLLGLEGNPWSWLNVRLLAGPDFRAYNSMAPVNDPHLITYYDEAALTATLTPAQTLAFTCKQWQWVSSTGWAPYFDSSFGLAYHWNATRQWGFDLGGKIQDADYGSGNDLAGSAPSLRNDIQYSVSTGINYAFNSHLNIGLTYNYDLGRNLDALAQKYEPDYRDFDHQLASLGVQYKF